MKLLCPLPRGSGRSAAAANPLDHGGPAPLESMPCGGSPLAHGLTRGRWRQCLGHRGSRPGGGGGHHRWTQQRSPEHLSGPTGAGGRGETRPQARVLDVAARYRMLGIKLLVIDTERKFIGSGMGKDLAEAAGGKYVQLPKASDQAIAAVAMDAISNI